MCLIESAVPLTGRVLEGLVTKVKLQLCVLVNQKKKITVIYKKMTIFKISSMLHNFKSYKTVQHRLPGWCDAECVLLASVHNITLHISDWYYCLSRMSSITSQNWYPVLELNKSDLPSDRQRRRILSCACCQGYQTHDQSQRLEERCKEIITYKVILNPDTKSFRNEFAANKYQYWL